MTEENIQTTQPTTTEIKTEVTPQVTNNSEKTIAVDLFGVQVELPIEKAKQLINSRDERTKEFKSLAGKVQEAEAKARQESERASLLEKMKANDVDAVREEASKEYKDKFEKLKNKIIDSSIKSEFSSIDGFNKEYINDAMQLFKASKTISLDEKEDIIVSGKPLKDEVVEFIKSKEIFLTGKKVVSTGNAPGKNLGGNIKSNTNPLGSQITPFDAIRKALENK